MAVLHFEDGASVVYKTTERTYRLYGFKREGVRPVMIELNQKEWDNPQFRHNFAAKAVKPIVGTVVLNKDIE